MSDSENEALITEDSSDAVGGSTLEQRVRIAPEERDGGLKQRPKTAGPVKGGKRTAKIRSSSPLKSPLKAIGGKEKHRPKTAGAARRKNASPSPMTRALDMRLSSPAKLIEEAILIDDSDSETGNGSVAEGWGSPESSRDKESQSPSKSARSTGRWSKFSPMPRSPPPRSVEETYHLYSPGTFGYMPPVPTIDVCRMWPKTELVKVDYTFSRDESDDSIFKRHSTDVELTSRLDSCERRLKICGTPAAKEPGLARPRPKSALKDRWDKFKDEYDKLMTEIGNGSPVRHANIRGAIQQLKEKHLGTHRAFEVDDIVAAGKLFESACAEGAEFVSEDQFVETFASVMSMTTEKCRRLYRFMNRREEVGLSWSDFLSYLLYEGLSVLTAQTVSGSYSLDPKPRRARQPPNSIVANCSNICMLKKKDETETSGYVICNLNGQVEIWDAGKLTYRCKLRAPRLNHKFPYLTGERYRDVDFNKRFQVNNRLWGLGIEYLPETHQICVASSDRSVTLYKEYHHTSWEEEDWFETKEACSCIYGWVHPRTNRQWILLGDVKGMVSAWVKPESKDDYRTVKMFKENQPYKMHHHHHFHQHEPITRIAITECGMVSTGMDGRYVIIDFDTWRKVAVINAHSRAINSMAYSHSHRTLVTAGADRLVQVWNPYNLKASKKPQHTLSFHASSVMHCYSVEKYNMLITASIDKIIAVWDLRNFRLVHSLKDVFFDRPQNYMTASAFDYTRFTLLTAGGTIQAWVIDESSGHTPARNEPPHVFQVAAIVVSDNFRTIATIDVQSVVRVWDMDTGKETLMYNLEHSDHVTTVHMNQNERWMATGSHNGEVKLWTIHNGRHVHTFSQRNYEITGLGFLSQEEGGYLLGVGASRVVSLWPDDTKKSSLNHGAGKSNKNPTMLEGHDAEVQCMAVYGRKVVTGDQAGALHLWDPITSIRPDRKVQVPVDETGSSPGVIKLLEFTRLLCLMVVVETGDVHLYHRSNIAVAREHIFNVEEGMTSMALTTECTHVAVGSESGMLRIFTVGVIQLDRRKINIVGIVPPPHRVDTNLDSAITALAWTEQMKSFIVGAQNGHVLFMGINGEEMCRILQTAPWPSSDKIISPHLTTMEHFKMRRRQSRGSIASAGTMPDGDDLSKLDQDIESEFALDDLPAHGKLQSSMPSRTGDVLSHISDDFDDSPMKIPPWRMSMAEIPTYEIPFDSTNEFTPRNNITYGSNVPFSSADIIAKVKDSEERRFKEKIDRKLERYFRRDELIEMENERNRKLKEEQRRKYLAHERKMKIQREIDARTRQKVSYQRTFNFAERLNKTKGQIEKETQEKASSVQNVALRLQKKFDAMDSKIFNLKKEKKVTAVTMKGKHAQPTKDLTAKKKLERKSSTVIQAKSPEGKEKTRPKDAGKQETKSVEVTTAVALAAFNRAEKLMSKDFVKRKEKLDGKADIEKPQDEVIKQQEIAASFASAAIRKFANNPLSKSKRHHANEAKHQQYMETVRNASKAVEIKDNAPPTLVQSKRLAEDKILNKKWQVGV